MSIMLRITDKELGAAEIVAPDLLVPLLTISAREILRLRVEAEVERYNVTRGASHFLIQPAPRESELNGREARFRELKVAPQIALAIEAVEKCRVIMLLNGRQVTSLDETF